MLELFVQSLPLAPFIFLIDKRIRNEDHVFKPDILTNDYQADMNSEPCEMLFVYETRDWNVERVLANKSLNQIASPNFQHSLCLVPLEHA